MSKTEREFKLDLWHFSYLLFNGLTKRVIRYFYDLRKSLLKAGMKVALEAYVSFIFLITFLTFITTFSISFVIIYFFMYYPLIFALIITIPLSVVISAITFGITYSYPSLRAGVIATRIEDDLPYAVAHMAVMATAGATPEAIIRSVASVPKDSVAEFMKDVIRDIDILGMDIITALERAKERAPAKTLEDFLSEMTAIIRTGGNIKDFLTSYGRTLLGTKAIEVRELSETLSTLAEVFIILMVVFPLLLIIMFSIMSLVGGTIAGLDIQTLMTFITYIMVPVLGVLFLIILDMVIPRGE